MRLRAAAGAEHPPRRPVVVAGASAGIGAQTARTLAAAGYPVALGARRTSACEDIAAEIRASGGEACAHHLDLGDSTSVHSFAKAVSEQLGDIEVVVANAGIMPSGTVMDTDPETLAVTCNVNLVGVQRLISTFVPRMIERGRGDFLVISSDIVETPRPFLGAYASSKWAVEGLVRVLAMESEGTGVRVSLVRPGATATEINATWDTEAGLKTLEWGKRFGHLRHLNLLPASAVADVVAYVVSAPRGTHIPLSYIAPEAPIDDTQ